MAEYINEEGEGMVIVEGPDGSGKSTLVRRLSEELSVPVHPRACTSDNGIDPATLRDWVDRDLHPSSEGGLYDRHPLISEPIYGPIIRNFMADGFQDIEWLGTSMTKFRNRVKAMIFCLPPWPFVETNVTKHHEATTPHLEGVLKHSQGLYEMYLHRAALEASAMDYVWVWDYTAHDRDQSFELLLSIVKGALT